MATVTHLKLKSEGETSGLSLNDWENEKNSANESDKSFHSTSETSPVKYKDFFKRFEVPHSTGQLRISNSLMTFTRYEDLEVVSILKIASEDSYILAEMYTELQGKPLESIHKSGNVEMSSTPKRESTTSSCRTNPVSDMDITGSPLAWHFQALKQPSLDLSLQDSFELNKLGNLTLKSFNGCPVKEARSILHSVRPSLEAVKALNLPPVWIACDGRDASKTAFVGLHINEKTSATCTIRSSSPHIGADRLPSLDLINANFELGSLLPRVNNKVEATYEVRSPKDSKRSSLTLTCSWTRPLFTLSPPGHDASTTANLLVQVNDRKSEAHLLYTELEFLKSLIEGLETNCLTWYQRKEGRVRVEDQLRKYFSAFNDGAGKRKSCREAVIDLDKIVEENFMRMRPDLEFMDEMWNILKGSEKFSELNNGFIEIFTNITSGVIRPKMHARSELKFVVMCRDLMTGKKSTADLESLEPIHMLIELGLEKIKKDYFSFFEAYDLVASEQLASYTNWSSKKLSFSQAFSKLEKMHLVLQIVVILRCSLNLPNSVLSHFTSKSLLDLEMKVNLPKDFEFQVDTSLVKGIIDNIIPSVWVYETWSECEENPSCTKWMKFAIQKDEPFFHAGDEVGKYVFSPVEENQNAETSVQNFYSMSFVRAGICI